MNTVLPIGSVVKIQGIKKPIMIFGYLQKSGLGNGKVIDYVEYHILREISDHKHRLDFSDMI